MLSRLRTTWRALRRRKAWEKDLEDELQLHIDLRAADLVRAGHSRESAVRQARLELGVLDPIKDDLRAAAGIRLFDELSQDLRYALRILCQSPIFTLVAIGSLTVGIGMNAALFTVVNTLLLRDLPYHDAGRLVYVTEYWPHEPVVPGPPSPDFANWRAHLKSADGIAAYGGGASALTLTGAGEPERIDGTMVTAQLLDLLGCNLAAGRNFTSEEDRLGAAPVVVLGSNLWQSRFGGSPDVIGKVIQLNGEGRTIVGVLPAGFVFPDNNFRQDLLVPMALPSNPSWRTPDSFRLLRVLVRRRPSVSLGALKSELTSLLRSTSAEEPPQMVTMRKDMEVRVTPLRQWLTGNVRTMLLVLQGAVVMVLLIACLNVASLQVARAMARRKEMALRAAIGASSARLVRQLMTESLLVCCLAGITGLTLGYSSLGVLRAYLPANLHLADLLRLDSSVLGYTLALTLMAAVLTGLIPARAILRVDLDSALKDGRSTGSRGQRRAHGILVVAEIAAAMVLLVGSSLLIRSFQRVASAQLGFDPKGILTLKVAPAPRSYPDQVSRAAFYTHIVERAQAIPAVQAAAMGAGLPLIGTAGAAGISFKDHPEPPLGGRPSLPVADVSPAYFEALKIPLLRGRLFAESDRLKTVAVVNQAFAQEFFPGEDALGKRIEIGSREGRWQEIIGIVGNVKEQGRRPVDPYIIYIPLGQAFAPEMFLILKSSLPLSRLVDPATRAVHGVDPNQPIYDVSSMEDRVSMSLSAQRANMTLMGIFASLALLLSTVGIFSVIAYFVNNRLHEIAIRIALGASRSTVVRMVLGHGMLLVAAGIVAGIGGALGLSRTLASMLEGVGANDLVSFVAASALFLAVTGLACSIPALRASAVDPMRALRNG